MNNPIAPMNAIYFQNYYAPTVYGVPGSSNLLDFRTVVVSGTHIAATLAAVNAPQTESALTGIPLLTDLTRRSTLRH
jgi:hypothetical protein